MSSFENLQSELDKWLIWIMIEPKERKTHMTLGELFWKCSELLKELPAETKLIVESYNCDAEAGDLIKFENYAALGVEWESVAYLTKK